MNKYFSEIVRQKWRHMAVVLSLLLFNILLYVVVSAYQLPSIVDKQKKWSELRQKVAGMGKIDAATLYQQGSADLEKLKSSIPEKINFARVLSDFFEAAVSSGVEVGNISYKPLKIKEEALLSYQLTLSVSGSYAAVKSYLADLQNNAELAVVDSVDFSNKDLFAENVVMNLRLTIYLREGA